MKKKGQIAIEFLLLIALAFGIVFTLLISALTLSSSDAKSKAYYIMEDLGNSLQQEFLLASEMEDGYIRKISLPAKLEGLSYNLTIGQINNSYGYMILTYSGAELYYLIPPVNGTILLGNNLLRKNNDTLRIN